MSKSNWTLNFLYVLALVLACGTQFAGAAMTNLLPIADTTLRDQDATGTNFGSSGELLVGIAKEPFFIQNRGLLKFDLTDLPTNATVTGVTLTVTITRSNTDPSIYDLNRMLVDWKENEATWENRFNSVPWLAGGGQSGTEYVSAASVTTEIDAGVFSSAGMISDVQAWIRNPGTNHGWIMIATGNEVATGKKLGSRESVFPPVLTVQYTMTPPAVADAPTLFGTSLVGNEFHFSFNAESNRVYVVDFHDSLPASGWNLLTNIAAQALNRTITITNVVSSSERYFRVHTP